MESFTNEPSGSPLPLPPELRLRRVCGVLEALSDALQGDADYSPHFYRRALAVDLAVSELRSIRRAIKRRGS